MEENKKCPKCNDKMEKGITVDGYGDVGNFPQESTWAKRRTTVLGIFAGSPEGERKIVTYRCTTCGYLESYAKDK